MRRRLFTVAPFLIGVGLLALTVLRADLRPLAHLTRQLGASLVVALLPGAVWHLLRTIAWQWSFPVSDHPSFARLARVRLAAEAFSFVTIRGVAGEPLKVVLLRGDAMPIVSAAAVALERVAYMFVTAAIVSVSAAAAMIVLPLTPGWMRVFGAIAAAGLVMIAVPVALLARRERVPTMHTAPTTASSSRRRAIVRFVVQLDAQFRELLRGDRRRLLALVALETAAYLMMVAEVWAALRLTHLPITAVDALAAETFTRVASMASAFIPANLGALEASNVAAAFAVHAAGGAAALALVRRLRGLFWCAIGFMIYPRTHARGEPALGAGESPDQAVRAHRADRSAATLVVLEHAAPEVTIAHHLGGLPIGERILRAAARGRFRRVLVWSPSQSADWNMLAARLRLALTVSAENDENAWRLLMGHLDPVTPVTVLAPGVIASPQTLTAGRDVTEIPVGPTGESFVFRMPPESALSPTALAEALAIAEGSARLASDGSADEDGALLLRARTLAELASAEDRLRDPNERAVTIPTAVACGYGCETYHMLRAREEDSPWSTHSISGSIYTRCSFRCVC